MYIKFYNGCSAQVLSAYQQIRNMCCMLRQKDRKRRRFSGDSYTSSGSSEDVLLVKVAVSSTMIL